MAKRKTISPWKPSRAEQLKSIRRRVPDVIAPNLDVLFCGINPGLYSAAVGHHFAGPGNLFWPTLLATGFTPRLFSAFDEAELLSMGFGITNIVPRASATAEDLTLDELRAGARTVRRKVRTYKPRYLAVLGLVAYRRAFEDNKAQVGLQADRIGSSSVYLLPNPSGLNAFHQPAVLHQLFSDFRQLVRDPSFVPKPFIPAEVTALRKSAADQKAPAKVRRARTKVAKASKAPAKIDKQSKA